MFSFSDTCGGPEILTFTGFPQPFLTNSGLGCSLVLGAAHFQVSASLEPLYRYYWTTVDSTGCVQLLVSFTVKTGGNIFNTPHPAD